MDISKIRKKHKQAKKRPESKKPEEVSEPERIPEEEEYAEEPEASEEPEATEERIVTEETEVTEENEVAEEPAEEPELSISEMESTAAVEEEERPLEPETTTSKSTEAVSEELEREEFVAEELTELLTFILAGEYYAFRVTGIHEVLRPQFVAKVPRAVDFIVGVTSLRGTIIPVMDLRQRLHVEGNDRRASNIIILKGVGRGIIGVLVDRTVDVIKIHESDILQPPSHLADSEARFIEGVTSQKDKFISIIDPEELLSFNAMKEDP